MIELVITFVVLGIISSVAALSLSSFGSRAGGVSAQAAIERAQTAEASFAASYGGYTSWPSDLALGQGITVTDGASTAVGQVSLALGSDGNLGIASVASNGTCFAEGLAASGGSAAGSVSPVTTTLSSCTGTAALAAIWPSASVVSPASVKW